MAIFCLIMSLLLSLAFCLLVATPEKPIRTLYNDEEVYAFLAWLEEQHRDPVSNWKSEGF